VVDALGDGFAGAGDGDGPLGRVGQHFRGDDDRGAGDFADLFDFRAAFADERTALRRWHDQTQRDRRSRNARARQWTTNFLFQLFANEVESLENGLRRPCDGDDPFGAGSIRNVDAGTRLIAEAFDDFSFFADDAPNFLAGHKKANSEGYGGSVVRQALVVYGSHRNVNYGYETQEDPVRSRNR